MKTKEQSAQETTATVTNTELRSTAEERHPEAKPRDPKPPYYSGPVESRLPRRSFMLGAMAALSATSWHSVAAAPAGSVEHNVPPDATKNPGTRKSISIALEPYDRHLPFVERRTFLSSGAELDIRFVGQLAEHKHGRNRHERFLHGREFDAAELSLSSYLMYRQRHDDIIALPIFPRRLFSFSNIWVRNDSKATKWADLASTVVGVPTFQMTLGIVARHDMAVVEGVDWKSMSWASSHPENVSVNAPVTRLTSPSLVHALISGEISAILTPEIPPDPAFRRQARRLYGERARSMELDLLKRRGYAPIMHLIAVRTSLVKQNPTLASELIDIFTAAQEQAWERYNDPGWGLAFWGRQELENQIDAVGHSSWSHGLENNRAALVDFCNASVAQGLIETSPDIDAIFLR